MDRRRALGLALVAVAVLGAIAMPFVNPLPVDHEQWSCCGGEAGVLMVARGPAVARYDAASDTTLAVFECGHHYCDVATQIAGNATAQVARAQTLLFSPSGTPAEGSVDLAEPILVPEGLSPAKNVTSMTAARFEVGRAYVPLLLDQILLVAGVVGVALAVRRSDVEALSGALGAALGLVVGAQLAAQGPALAGLATALLVAAAAGGVAALVLARKHPRAWLVATFLLGLAAALLFSQLVAGAFFAHDPMD